MSEKIEKYIKKEKVSEELISEYVLVESVELQAIMMAIDKTKEELEKNKKVSANLLMDFMNLQKRIEKLLKKPLFGPAAREAKILQSMLDKALNG